MSNKLKKRNIRFPDEVHECPTCHRATANPAAFVMTIEDLPNGGYRSISDYDMQHSFQQMSPAHHAGALLTAHARTLGVQVPANATEEEITQACLDAQALEQQKESSHGTTQ